MDTLHSLARRVQGHAQGIDIPFTRVGTDTRTLQPGDLFVALKGDRFDGHDHVDQAAARGAAGALVSRPLAVDLPQVVVHDTLQGLQDYAASWRAGFDLPVLAVTGSNGKTTTKQLLSAVVAARGPLLATQGNLNNHIGVPLTLLGLRAEHCTAVIEMGANHPGEIARLSEIARPAIGVVTQAGDAHLEGFGSREGVAKAKGELFASLGAGGVAVINNDDAYAPLWKTMAARAAQITFSLTEQADVSALNVQPSVAGGSTRFELRVPEGRAPVTLPLPGLHNVSNALAAAACAVALGMELQTIADGLTRVQPASGRLAATVTPQGARLLDDSYNANPSSLRAGVEVLAGFGGRRVLVLGDMGELGANAEQQHFDAGVAARARGIDALYALGRLSRAAVEGFGPGARHFDAIEDLIAALKSQLDSHTTLLVKGSRSSRMERVTAALTGVTDSETH